MIEGIIAAVLGAIFGIGGTVVYEKRRQAAGKNKAEQEIAKAKIKAGDIVLKAKDEALELENERRREWKKTEQRLADREVSLDKKLDEIDRRTDKLRKQEDEVEELKTDVRDIRSRQQEKLEKIAGLKKADAADKLMKMTERDIKDDLVGLVNKLQKDAMDDAEERAQTIILTAMERMSSEVTAERTVTAIKLTDEEMKGRIIGKEGRNIQALQRATGVDILVDDTPGMIILSSFDPIRRQIARQTLELLMKDGRIHPGRIEEVVAKAEKQIDKDITRAGEDAVREVGVAGIPKEMVRLLGELKFRTSYGQNVLMHSTEMAHMAGLIAEEIGANVRTTKIATLLHDVGKAVTHKIEGKHHHIGAELARKYGMSDDIVHAIEAHHDDIEATTPEALIVRVCDALSAARPGARNISAENFVERMRDLENVAKSFDGIDKAYAISAGREIRVIVSPKHIDDLNAIKLARDIATKIESTMQYPGTIKVNVIRETRAIEFAK
ncbi:TPA: ribonuclease Y [Candidatus Saccharibacteria bacterium]|nr:MAG: rny, Ribonuclease Y [Candidatus Saccharibacteria bacterium GW2011_GWC2_44_17]MBH1956791.1 ribonuclease Y [Candidatus Saccharibacteria bacterium]OGL24177.1 MAG: ribonuclease Y [Candidatus Saccharibacteria bacterium RIFCSPHIGHO2_01_FULL_46_30]OGL33845.1 MAG: ribonuclease Y [Candidatus Saccharibacteria bacterium RIFCSPHIGHO2_12_FULL_47_16]MBH1973421.1 ribonuclease Y [Candidatus Saccharibacteria bacterium]